MSQVKNSKHFYQMVVVIEGMALLTKLFSATDCFRIRFFLKFHVQFWLLCVYYLHNNNKTYRLTNQSYFSIRLQGFIWGDAASMKCEAQAQCLNMLQTWQSDLNLVKGDQNQNKKSAWFGSLLKFLICSGSVYKMVAMSPYSLLITCMIFVTLRSEVTFDPFISS